MMDKEVKFAFTIEATMFGQPFFLANLYLPLRKETITHITIIPINGLEYSRIITLVPDL